MKSNTITLFLSTGIVISIPRLSDKKLSKLEDIIASPPSECAWYHVFKHEDTRYFIKPIDIAMYTIQTEKVTLR